jgi:adenosylcobinamide kinase/adenosylcobinamide-phosphate guanylyltransferase
MGKSLILILGGARSGKSAYAQKLMEQSIEPVLFVATATAGDEEMAARIAAHQNSRPANWMTLEVSAGVGQAIRRTSTPCNVLIDCLTLLASNVLMACPQPLEESFYERAMQQEIDELISAYQAHDGKWLVVSNEVGLGLVPPTPLGRYYRDALGRSNQRLAEVADQVLFMVAGLPMKVK